MGNDQSANSRTILDQVFWAGVTPPPQGDAQPAAKDAPHEPAAVVSAQAILPPLEPEPILDPHNSIRPETVAGADMAPLTISATNRDALKAEVNEPEPAEEIPTISSPAVQPTLIEDADFTHQQFRMMLQGDAAGAAPVPADSRPPSDDGAGGREPAVQVELQDVLKSASLDDKKRGEINELMETLRRNLDKIEQHGKRADALLKRMQMHSREALVNIGPPAPMPPPDESVPYPEEVRRSA